MESILSLWALNVAVNSIHACAACVTTYVVLVTTLSFPIMISYMALSIRVMKILSLETSSLEDDHSFLRAAEAGGVSILARFSGTHAVQHTEPGIMACTWL